jgi:hypothetical protein
VARHAVRLGVLALGATLLLAGCGGGMPAQDEDEPTGEFPLIVTEASFPTQQRLADDSSLVVDVRNVGDETVPNINVTVTGFDRKLRDPLNESQIDPSVAAPARPVFVLDRSPQEALAEKTEENPSLVDREVEVPYGRKTAYVDTYSLGELPPGEDARFRWDVSAVEAGGFKVRYQVNAGLDGKAVAVSQGGEPLTDTFTGVITDTPPPASVAGDGQIVNRQASPSGAGGSGVILGD